MTPYQYGQSAAPSNMAFPTAAYMQAAGNAAGLRAKGMESLGAGIAKGMDAVTAYLKESRDMQSAVKGGEKFLSFLGKAGVQSGAFGQDTIDEMNAMLSDPSLSVRDKANLIPAMAGQMQSVIKYKNELAGHQQQMLNQAKLELAKAGGIGPVYGPSPRVGGTSTGTSKGAVSVDINNLGGDVSGYPPIQGPTQNGMPLDYGDYQQAYQGPMQSGKTVDSPDWSKNPYNQSYKFD